MILYKEKLLDLEEQAETYECIIHPGIPVLPEVEKRLEAGMQHVAEIGCGEGETTILMAQSYPKSFFTGIDPDYKSILNARGNAKKAKLTGRVSFLVGSEKSYFGTQYDIVITHPAYNQPENFLETAAFVREKLRANGIWLAVTPVNLENEEYLRSLAELSGFFTSTGYRKRKAG